jgi:hypothetical protein
MVIGSFNVGMLSQCPNQNLNPETADDCFSAALAAWILSAIARSDASDYRF